MSDSPLQSISSSNFQPHLHRRFMSLEVRSPSPTPISQSQQHVIFPINRLPTELLSYILTLTLQSLIAGNPAVDGYRRLAYSFPAIPCLTCRKWRKIAFETPHLWTYITIQSRTPFSHLADRIARSGVLPLDAEVTFTAILPEADYAIFGLWAYLLSNASQRIQHLYLRIRKQENVAQLCQSLPPRLPALRTLYLHVVLASSLPTDDDNDVDGPPRIQFAAVDQLQSLSLRYTNISWTQLNFTVLRELIISEPAEISEEELLRALKSMKELRVLSITDPNIISSSTDSSSSSPPPEYEPRRRRERAKLPNLVELKIYDAYCDNIAIIFSLIDVPILEKLVLRGAKESSEAWTPGEILGAHLFDQLQQLAISDLPHNDAVLEDLNIAAPNLTYLAVYLRNNTKLIRDFTSDEHSSPETMIFPHLKELTTRNVPIDTLRAIVEMRKPRIERLNVHITDIGIQLPPFNPETTLNDVPPSFTQFEDDSVWLKENIGRMEVFGLLVEGWGKVDRYRSWDEWMDGRSVGRQDVTINEHTLFTWS
ncbi:hypothetical protein FRC02_008524 [Tulasnella sp. 418]|nr:hypothetical protein FRC02_008524 [Tulasnella sp. 418]